MTLATGFIFFAVITGNHLINYQILHAEKTYPQYKLKLLDVAGISKLSGENYFPDCISSYKDFSKEKILHQYSPASMDDIYWPSDGSKPMIRNPDKDLNDCMDSSWKTAISQHPLLYLKNRWSGFIYYLRIKKRFQMSDYWNIAIWIDPNNPLHVVGQDNYFIVFAKHIYTALGETPFFDPWLWLLANLCLLAHYARQFYKSKFFHLYKTHAFIQLSAVLFMLSQFFIYQHDRDFRYTYWNILALFIGIVGLIHQNFNKKELKNYLNIKNVDHENQDSPIII